jgi:glycosyltransferase involved in cell wall biosynthesis
MQTDKFALRVQKERLLQAQGLPLFQRWFLRGFAHVLVYIVRCFALIGRFFRNASQCSHQRPPARIVLTGGIDADNWITAHAAPLALSDYCSHMWVVVDRPFEPIRKVTFTVPPSWLIKLLGRVPARLLWFAIISLIRRADIVGGFHLLFNGLFSIVVAALINARAIYFCVGGWAEIIGGGAYSGHPLFGKIGINDVSLENAMLKAVRSFDLIITMGKYAREYFLKHGASRIAVIPGGIDQNSFQQSRPYHERVFDLILVARLDPIKRVDIFLKVVNEVAKSIQKVSAVIVGDGPLKPELETLAEDLGVSGHVSFAGFKNDVATWLNKSKLFVLTSDSEGVALSAMEALMVGIPVIASRVGDLSDIVQDGINGYLVQPRNVEEFAERIVQVLSDDGLLRRYSIAASKSSEAFKFETACSNWTKELNQMGYGKSI